MNIRSEIIGLFETEYMRSVMAENYDSLDAHELAKVVAGSRATLAKKAALLEELSKDKPKLEPYRDAFRWALGELQPKNDARIVWQVCSYWIDPSSPNFDYVEMASCACCASFVAAQDAIRREVAEESEESNEYGLSDAQEWYQVDKCILNEDGQSCVRVSYWCGLDAEPRYFSAEEVPFALDSNYAPEVGSCTERKEFASKRSAYIFRHGFWPGPNSMPTLLRLPLSLGEVVMLDCMPYMLPQPAIITCNDGSQECCLPQALAQDGQGILREGALKHGHIGGSDGCISPLYRLRKDGEEELPVDSPIWYLAALLTDDDLRSRFESINRFAAPEFDAEAWVWLLGQEWLEDGEYPDPADFIDSKDIRDHCRKVGWQPTSLEAAYLIWQSRTRTLASKHAAWQLMIKTLPDAPITEGRNRASFPSLHEFLRDYMRFERDVLHFILSGDSSSKWYWMFEGVYQNGEVKAGPACASPSEALVMLSDWHERGEFEDMRDGPRWPKSFVLTKAALGSTYKARVRLSEDLEPIEILDARGYPLNEEQNRLWCCSFMGMWIDVPLPFETGDVLCYVPNAGRDEHFVLSHPANARDAGLLVRLLADGDESDMSVSGYCVDDEGGFVHFHAHYHEVLKLAYYNDELKGYEHKLVHLSSFAKGEIDLAECMRRCDVAGAEVRAETDAKYAKEQREEIAFQFGEC